MTRQYHPREYAIVHEMGPRFWSKVEKTDSCWLWRGTDGTHGYGYFSVKGINLYAHRIAYLLEVGPIPEGYQIDHLCMNKGCVNPAHLEPVTGAENTRRWAQSLTHCKNGHLKTAENTYIWHGHPRCRICNSEAVRRRRLDDKHDPRIELTVEPVPPA